MLIAIGLFVVFIVFLCLFIEKCECGKYTFALGSSFKCKKCGKHTHNEDCFYQ